MTRMFHDMEEDAVRTRIRKFRDEGSHPKNRLVEAAVLVDLVERMLNQPEDKCGEADAPVPEAESAPPSEDEKHQQRTGLLGKLFP